MSAAFCVQMHTTVSPCTVGGCVRPICLSWLSFISIILQALLGASQLPELYEYGSHAACGYRVKLQRQQCMMYDTYIS